MNRLKEFRERAGFSRKTLAAEVGMSDTTVRKLEQGKYGGPTLETARLLANALKCAGALKGQKGHIIDVVFPWGSQE